jgi:hypothetical protein
MAGIVGRRTKTNKEARLTTGPFPFRTRRAVQRDYRACAAPSIGAQARVRHNAGVAVVGVGAKPRLPTRVTDAGELGSARRSSLDHLTTPPVDARSGRWRIPRRHLRGNGMEHYRLSSVGCDIRSALWGEADQCRTKSF